MPPPPFQSMFVRRLAVLMGCFVLLTIPLLARLWYLAVHKGSDLYDQAQARLVKRAFAPTVRGRILDRQGRVLAEDRASYDLLVDYGVLDGSWSTTTARAAARKIAGSRWLTMSKPQRDALAGAMVPAFEAHLEVSWKRLAQTLGTPLSVLSGKRMEILTTTDAKQVFIAKEREKNIYSEFRGRGEEVDPGQLARITRKANEPISDLKRAHTLVAGVDDSMAFACAALTDGEAEVLLPAGIISAELGSTTDARYTVAMFPGLHVADTTQREYPLDRITVELPRESLPTPLKTQSSASITVEGVACQLLGRVRRSVYAEDVESRDRFLAINPSLRSRAFWTDGPSKPIDLGAYRDGDIVGTAGVEASCENLLRGLRGVQLLRRDSDDSTTLPAVHGADTPLTLDIMLQARVQAIMSGEFGLATVQPWQWPDDALPPVPFGTTLAGAAVVLDVASGDVLAAVSTPTFSRAQWEQAPETVYEDAIGTPFVNRCWNKDYPPGSIVKPMMLVGAVEEGVYDLAERIKCNGHMLAGNPNVLQCLIWKKFKATHSGILERDLNGKDAIAQSCNVFFFTLGSRLGPTGIDHVYRTFGVGSRFGLRAGPEFLGHLGSIDGRALSVGDATQMGIGQGPVSWTPMHAANAYATLARGGISKKPRLILDTTKQEIKDLRLSKAAMKMALDGIWSVVNDVDATGNHLTIHGTREPIFNTPGVKVWGKTGTAEAPPLRIDPDGKEGPLDAAIAREGDHSWFVVLVGKDEPTHAIAVVMEYAGSGGKVSGPICNQIVRALLHEGYL